ncbi:hypothetical protein MEBOL_006727 [Melittangium boletus DSM 14713]|uniref:Uncharacterized protein n=2 Tax=Melittangium boletus TaxID=83453 RepID=A0A250IPN7_9BACT|nr:hypothetical protein MEBOL_006727 [Melittangium boletus DSM 14713]
MKYALDPRLLPPGGVPVQCTRCSHVFIAGTPEPAPRPAAKPAPKPAPARPPSAVNSTLLYGANNSNHPNPDTGGAPIPTGTQVFGMAPQTPQVPSIAPVAAPKAPPAAARPSAVALKTQTFGAVPQPTPAVAKAAPPAAGRPPAGAAPPPTGKPPMGAPPPQTAGKPPVGAPPPQTTQVFGAVPPPAPAPKPQGRVPPVAGTSPSVPGARPTPARPSGTPPQPMAAAKPPVKTEDVPWGPEPVGTSPFTVTASPLMGLPQGALRTEPLDEPSAQVFSQPPGLLPRHAAPERIPPEPEPLLPEPSIGVAATTPIELPDEILNQLNRPLSELMAEEEPLPREPLPREPPLQGGPTPALSKPLELPPELIENAGKPARDDTQDKLKAKRLKRRALLIGGGVLVIGLTAVLSSPSFRAKSDVLPPATQEAREKAVALLRRDDATSQEEALTQLKILSAEHPQNVELLAEVGIALALHLDDTQVRVKTFQAMEKRLRARINRLTVSQTPADWRSRVNTMNEELAVIQQRVVPLDERSKDLSKDAVQAIKKLDSIPREESPRDALARLRARALMNGALGGMDAPALAVKLAQAELRDWSALAMAEFALHETPPSRTQLQNAVSAMERMMESNRTYLRPYVLGARLALMRDQPAAAQALLETVITLNPKHELAQQLLDYARVLEEPEPEPLPQPKRQLPPGAPDTGNAPAAPVPEGTSGSSGP